MEGERERRRVTVMLQTDTVPVTAVTLNVSFNRNMISY